MEVIALGICPRKTRLAFDENHVYMYMYMYKQLVRMKHNYSLGWCLNRYMYSTCQLPNIGE